VIAVVGGGLSLTGYNESQQVTTSTSTYTSVVTLTSTASHVITTSLVRSIYHQKWSSLNGSQWLCLGETFDLGHLDGGQLHISYNASTLWKGDYGVGLVNFWLLDDQGLTQWGRHNCDEGRAGFPAGIAYNFDSSSYDSTVDIPSSGNYHIIFLDPTIIPMQVTLNVDYISPPTAVTTYSTRTSTVTTQMMKPVSQPVGLGIPFFSGIGLVAVAVIAIAAAVRRKGRIAPSRSTPSAASLSPPQASQGMFCMNCGAPLPSHAPYCSECGSKQ